MWFIGVEVEQETSAPPPKKYPGSAPVLAGFAIIMQNKPNRIFHPTEKQEKNKKTLQKELTEGGWMAEKDCNAHFVLMSLR